MKALGYTKNQAPGAISPYLPDFIANDIADVDFSRLKELGVTHLMLDLDGTLRRAYSRQLESEVIDVFRKLNDEKTFDVIAVVSNNHFRIQKFGEPIGARVFQPFWHGSRVIRKPHPLFFKRVLKELGIKPSQAAMIGDKLRSDIVGANKVGIRTILLKQRGTDYWFDHILLYRLRERHYFERALQARRLHFPSTLRYLKDALEAADLPSKQIERLSNDATRSTSFLASDGKKAVFIKLVSRQHTFFGKLYKAWRRLTFRSLPDELSLSPDNALEHEAYLASQAFAAGVRTPKTRQLIDMGDQRYALAFEYIEGITLDKFQKKRITDTLLQEVWRQVTLLHKANIAHGDLRTTNILLRKSTPWLIDFDRAHDLPSKQDLLKDNLALLVTTAQAVGSGRAVRAASSHITLEDYEAMLPLLAENYLQEALRLSVKRSLLYDLRKTIETLG